LFVAVGFSTVTSKVILLQGMRCAKVEEYAELQARELI